MKLKYPLTDFTKPLSKSILDQNWILCNPLKTGKTHQISCLLTFFFITSIVWLKWTLDQSQTLIMICYALILLICLSLTSFAHTNWTKPTESQILLSFKRILTKLDIETKTTLDLCLFISNTDEPAKLKPQINLKPQIHTKPNTPL